MKPKTTLLFIAGYAGVGKTTIGRELAHMLGYTLLDKDIITEKYTKYVLGDKNYSSDLYMNDLRDLEYDILVDIINDNLLVGNNIIVTAPFVQELSDKRWIERFDGFNQDVDIKVLTVTLDSDEEYKRIMSRYSERDRDKLNDWDTYVAMRDNITCEWDIPMENIKELNNMDPITSKTLILLSEWVKE